MKKLALIFSIIGIFILVLISNLSEINELNIEEISKSQLNEKIKISGKVSDVLINKDDFVVFKVYNNVSYIKVICNCSTIKKNQDLIIIGRLTKYKNELQIQADKIIILT